MLSDRPPLTYWIWDVFTSSPFHGNPAAVILCPDPSTPEFDDIPLLIRYSSEFAQPNTAVIRPTTDPNRWDLRVFTRKDEIALCGHATMAAAYTIVRELQVVDLDQGDLVLCTKMGKGDLQVTKKGEWLGIELPADHSVLPSQQVDSDPETQARAEVRNVVVGSAKGLTEEEILAVTRTTTRGWIVELSSKVELRRLQVNTDPFINLTPLMVILTQASPEPNGGIRSRVFAPSMSTIEDQVCGSAHCAVVPYWLGDPAARSRLAPTSIVKTGESEGIEVVHMSERGGVMHVVWKMGGTCVLSGNAVLAAKGEAFLPAA